ncbi:MAG: carboxypeptidase regulatory-like domain-containing protein [Candidatus Binatia bacterium]
MYGKGFAIMLLATATLSWNAVSAYAYEGGAVTNGGTISGIVKLQGTAPAAKTIEVTKDKQVCGKHPIKNEDLLVGPQGGIANAVVSITNISKGKAMERATPVLDQKGCVYRPHVLLFPAGSTVKIKNDDGILHNIHTYSEKNPPINRAQPKFKKTIKEKFAEPEVVKVTCDAHGWMHGWFVVQDNPYYAKTDANGHFTLTDVPAGDYELKVWQEKLGEKTQKVTVPAGGEAKVTFELTQK